MPIDLGDYGRAALKITSARYYTPKGVCINREPEATEWGVAPDIEARVPKEERRRHWEDRSKAWVELNSARDGDELPDWPKGPQLDRAYEHLMKVLGGEPAREEALPAAGAGDAPD